MKDSEAHEKLNRLENELSDVRSMLHSLAYKLGYKIEGSQYSTGITIREKCKECGK